MKDSSHTVVHRIATAQNPGIFVDIQYQLAVSLSGGTFLSKITISVSKSVCESDHGNIGDIKRLNQVRKENLEKRSK